MGELTIHVGYKRTFQLKPYETQVIEFAVSGTDIKSVLAQCTPESLQKMADAYQAIEETGDAIIANSLAKGNEAKEPDSRGFSPPPSQRRPK